MARKAAARPTKKAAPEEAARKGGTDDDKLIKIVVDLPNHWAAGGEGLWAHALGDDLYRIDNVPFHAYGLNFGDVVLASADGPDRKPEIRRVVRPSGHQTVRVAFGKDVDEDRMIALLEAMEPLHVSFERATTRYFALDIEPGADADRVRDHLDDLERQGLLDYETCEERVPGSFGDRPDDDEAPAD